MKIHYCLECAEPLVKHDPTCYECANGHQYFNNPHTGTSIVFLKDDSVLLVKRRIQPHKGQLGFPGGFLEYGESPYDAAKREIKEETGVDLTKLRLLEVNTTHYEENESACSIVFLAEEWHGEFHAADDAESIVWKPIDYITQGDMAWHYPGLAAKLKAIARSQD